MVSWLPSQTGEFDPDVAVKDNGTGIVRPNDRLALTQSLDPCISQKLFQPFVIISNLSGNLWRRFLSSAIVRSVQQTTPDRLNHWLLTGLKWTGQGEKKAGSKQEGSE